MDKADTAMGLRGTNDEFWDVRMPGVVVNMDDYS
jgi:hypothetical protein